MSSATTSQDRLAAQVLIVDDEGEHAEVMAEALKKPGHICTIVNSVPQALDELKHGQFDIVVTDLRMPNSGGANNVAMDGSDAGLRVLEAVRRVQPTAETIMVTAHGDVATARAAFKFGAYDFIEKPLDLAVFRELVNRAAETVLLRHEAGPARSASVITASSGSGSATNASGPSASTPTGGELRDIVQHDGFEGIIAGSETMRRILATVRAVSPSIIPVLITGESGTGKELIAQAVHRQSPRGKNRFVAFNCAGQAESLLEDTLFGHVRGAFTGADKEREGLFEYASGGQVPASTAPGAWAKGGTLFLDEIGDMPLTMQAKLLRTLETGEIVRLGANDPRRCDVRFVSATNKNLERAVAEGSFRQDLYYRIKGAHVHLPPLRERREDIPRIIRHGVAKFSSQLLGPAVHAPDITDAALMRLAAFHWPGNVRQLLNVVQNMVVMTIGEQGPGAAHPVDSGAMRIDVRHIPDDIRSDDGHDDAAGSDPGAADSSDSVTPGSLAGASLELLEKKAIRETLRLTAGNREHAAKLLGIGERTLYRKLKEYGLR
jgi:DNA-binding NtrC family response regulator